MKINANKDKLAGITVAKATEPVFSVLTLLFGHKLCNETLMTFNKLLNMKT